MRGAVVCSNQIAADAGAQIIRQGGNAVDAAITTALSLCVVDPANCGIGGYGGFMLIQESHENPPILIDFNTVASKNFKPDLSQKINPQDAFFNGATSVAVPMVLDGLVRAHREFGTKSFAELCEAPILVAKNGFTIGKNLDMAIRWAEGRDSQFSEPFKSIFAPQGRWLGIGEILIQKDLSSTLEKIQTNSNGYFYLGDFALKTSKFLREQGGWIEIEDFNNAESRISSAPQFHYDDCDIFGPPQRISGFGVVCDALNFLTKSDIDIFDNENLYIQKVSESLRFGWNIKNSEFNNLSKSSQHTSHFCITDLDGMSVTCTFTHGPLWFGSGMITPGTGVILNCAANLFRQVANSNEWLCVTNLCPNILNLKGGDFLVSGSPGGSRIPAIILQIILEMTKGGKDLSEAINNKRVSVSPSGELELEDINLARIYKAKRIFKEDYFGPSSAILQKKNGDIFVGRDERFEVGVAQI
jgi:gamma-glutamyltranspeptidase / glutathione hydrolase